jgi:hypothetical protein
MMHITWKQHNPFTVCEENLTVGICYYSSNYKNLTMNLTPNT